MGSLGIWLANYHMGGLDLVIELIPMALKESLILCGLWWSMGTENWDGVAEIMGATTEANKATPGEAWASMGIGNKSIWL